MKHKITPYFLILLFILIFPLKSSAIAISLVDLWDISNGSLISDTSGVLNYRPTYRSDIQDMFGASTLGIVEPTNTIFKDYMQPGYSGGPVPPGFIHYVEWNTPIPVTLRSFSLHAQNETMDRRAFNQFDLYWKNAGSWTSIYSTGPGYSYNGFLDLSVDIMPITAQFFRAEFVQAPWTIYNSNAIGPRIQELDGFDTFLDGSTVGNDVPEPTSILLIGFGLLGLTGLRKKN